MDLSIRRVAKTSSLSGVAFEERETVVCFLYRGTDGELERADLREEEVASWHATGPILCRWRHRLRPVASDDAEARRQSLASAEELFFALVGEETTEAEGALPGGDRAERDRAILLNLLALMLERKRVLKAIRGQPGNFLYGPEKKVVRVLPVELDPLEIAPLVAELEGLL